MDNRGNMIQEEFYGARIRVLGTNLVIPEDGRVFVWTKTGWFERVEGSSGNVAFTPIAENESELRDLIAGEDPNSELVELGGDFRRLVSEEFSDQSTYLEDTPADPFDEPLDEDDDQQYHTHDL